MTTALIIQHTFVVNGIIHYPQVTHSDYPNRIFTVEARGNYIFFVPPKPEDGGIYLGVVDMQKLTLIRKDYQTLLSEAKNNRKFIPVMQAIMNAEITISQDSPINNRIEWTDLLIKDRPWRRDHHPVVCADGHGANLLTIWPDFSITASTSKAAIPVSLFEALGAMGYNVRNLKENEYTELPLFD